MGGKAEGGMRVSWQDGMKIAMEIIDELKKVPGVERVEIAGSLRRQKPDVGDVDLIVLVKDRVELDKKMTEWWGLQKNGKAKHSGLIKQVQIDVNVADEENFGGMWMFSTGSATLNIAQRALAKTMGLKLNEKGLWKGEERVAGRTEEEIYEKLGIEWLSPEKR